MRYLLAFASIHVAALGAFQPGTMEYHFGDRSLNPANGLEGPLPACQRPESHPEEVDASDILRGPGLTVAYLANGFGAAGWAGPSGGRLTREAAIDSAKYFEFQLGPQPRHTLLVQQITAWISHPAAGSGRLEQFEWQVSADNFLTAPVFVQNFTLQEATPSANSTYQLPVLNLKDTDIPVLNSFERLTVRLYAWDSDSYTGTVSKFTVMGIAQQSPSDAVGLRIELVTAAAESWEIRYIRWLQLHNLSPDDNNLLAFIFGIDPTSPPMSLSQPEALRIYQKDGEWWAQLNYATEATGLRILFEQSSNLQSWGSLSSPKIHSPGRINFLIPN